VYPPYSDALLSLATVRAHQRWLSVHDVRHGKLSLRDVFTHYGWLCELVSAEGVLELFHSPKMTGRDWMQEFALAAPQSADWIHQTPSEPNFGVSVRPLVRSRLRRHEPPACDGSLCGHRCLFLHCLFLALPVIINWESSPLTAATATSCELHPMLSIRRQRLSASDIAQQESLIHSMAESVLSGQGGRGERQQEEAECVELSHAVQVNAAFERLLGYSQAELRSLYVSQGERVLYRLLRSDVWETVLVLDKEVKWEMRSDYRIYAVCLNKWQTELPCLLHAMVDYDEDGYQRETRLIFVPLPENSSGPKC
jgi:PAS domain-containing protein